MGSSRRIGHSKLFFHIKKNIIIRVLFVFQFVFISDAFDWNKFKQEKIEEKY